jgi:DNA helicase IV
VLSIEAISDITGLKPFILNTNYRLPRSVAKITQEYVGINVQKYSEKIYKNESKELPHFIKYDTEDSLYKGLLEIIDKYKEKKIGVLLPTNKEVLEIYDYLSRNDVLVELKYSDKKEHYNSVDSLNFVSNYPKLMTYHSAKGLQFDVVILPLFKGMTSDNDRRKLYVAMTRTMGSLYVLYNTPSIPSPLNSVPLELYLKK